MSLNIWANCQPNIFFETIFAINNKNYSRIINVTHDQKIFCNKRFLILHKILRSYLRNLPVFLIKFHHYDNILYSQMTIGAVVAINLNGISNGPKNLILSCLIRDKKIVLTKTVVALVNFIIFCYFIHFFYLMIN